MKKLSGFRVWPKDGGKQETERRLAITNDGVMLMETPRGWITVPNDGRYMVVYGDGDAEVY